VVWAIGDVRAVGEGVRYAVNLQVQTVVWVWSIFPTGRVWLAATGSSFGM